MALDAVYDHMKTQNRPYSVNDVVMNLNNEFGKAAVQKVMDQLVKDGKLFEKTYGKQKVYCIVQSPMHDADELTRIDRELQTHANEIHDKYQVTMREIKEQEAILSSLKMSLALEEAEAEKVALQESVNQLLSKLEKLMGTSNCKELQESKRKAQVELDEYSREYSKRKRMCMEIVDCILENYQGSKDELYEEVGIDSTTVK